MAKKRRKSIMRQWCADLTRANKGKRRVPYPQVEEIMKKATRDLYTNRQILVAALRNGQNQVKRSK